VMVDGSRCGKVVHSGAVLMAATGSSEGTEGGATRQLDGGRTRRHSGGDVREEERLFTGGLGSLYSRYRRWTEAARRRIRGRRNGGGESMAPVVPRFRQATRGLRERGAAVRPVGSGRFNRVGWYCRHGLGPIRCNFFPIIQTLLQF
jgi:hypothetical protein